MPTLSKDTLKPGVFRKGDQLHVVPRERITDLQESFSTLREKGYRFPVVMEHPGLDNEQSYPVHETDEQKIKALEEDPMFVGWINGVKVSSDGAVRSELEVETEDMAKKLTKRGSFVSPQFGPFKDKDGETHFAFHHLALTRKPVIKDQAKQFLRVQAFSEAEAVDEDEVYQFGLANEVMEFDSYGGGSFDTSPDRAVRDQSEESDEDQTSARLKRAFQQALSSMGVHVAEDSPIFNDADAMQQLMSLLHSCVGKQKEAAAMPAKTTNGQPAPDGSQTPAGTDGRNITVTMSDWESQQATIKELQSKVTVLSASNDVQQAALTKLEQDKLNARIDACEKSGRITADDAKGLRAVVNTYQFSEATKSENQIAIARLETFERLPKGTFFTDEQKIREFSLQTHDVATSEFGIGGGEEMTDERLNAALKEEGYGDNPEAVWKGGIKQV